MIRGPRNDTSRRVAGRVGPWIALSCWSDYEGGALTQSKAQKITIKEHKILNIIRVLPQIGESSQIRGLELSANQKPRKPPSWNTK